jgi:ATP-dependent Clp protease adaptor protein ClpS
MSKTSTQAKTTVNTKITFPPRYKVIIFNDNHTPMEFVIKLLIEVFNKNIDQASEITQAIHTKGRGVAGIYNYELAEQKLTESQIICQYNGHPLRVDLEPL